MKSNSTTSIWNKLQRPKYRDAFIATNVGVQIASQLHALRTNRGKSQEKLADEMGMNQATISLMEKSDYRKYNIGTLIRFAQHYKVALDVRFVSLVDHVRRIVDQTPESLAPPPFGEPLVVPDPQVAETAVQETTVSQRPVPLSDFVPKKAPEQESPDLMKLGEKMELVRSTVREAQSGIV